MRFFLTWPVCLAITFLLTMPVRADEQKVGLKKVPQPVLDAIKNRFPDSELSKAVKETEGGKSLFKISFSFKKHNYEAECLADGTFEDINREIDLTELPEKVARALKDKYPKARINLIEEVTRNNQVAQYDVELVTADKEEVEVQLTTDGTIQKVNNKGK